MPTKKKAKHKTSGRASGSTHTTRAPHTTSHISDAKNTHQILANLETALTDIAAAITSLASGSGLQASGEVQNVKQAQRSESREQRQRREKRALLEEKMALLEEKMSAMAEEMALLDEEDEEVASDEWLVASDKVGRPGDATSATTRRRDVAFDNPSARCNPTSNTGGGHGDPSFLNSSHSPLATSHSARAKLPAPANLVAVPVGSSFMRVSWNAVVGAKGYLVQYSSDSAFVNDTHAIIIDAPGTSLTLSGLLANTMYHIKVKSLADSGDTDSDFTMAYLAKTGVPASGETATHLQSFLAEQQGVFQSFTTLLPQLDSTVLTVAERRRLLGSGVRRYGYVDKVSDVAIDYPQFWPASADFQDALKERLREIEALRSLMVWTRYVNRVVGDMLLLAGHDAFRMASAYYSSVRAAARSNLPEAQQVFQMLNAFWNKRRNISAEPTKKQTMRNVKALLNGTREGEMYFENENDTVTKGKKKIVDKTRKKSRNGFKEVETGSSEFSDQVGDFGEYDDELSAVD